MFGTINAGRYFTNLINNNGHDVVGSLSGQNSLSAEEKLPPVQVPTSVRPNQKRSKNFSEEEDNLLVSAWLNVSLDPVQGTDQARSTYWNRIYDYFHSNKTFPSNRSQCSLMHHWAGIRESVNKFAGCLTQIEGRNQSGVSIQDKVMQACTMFKAEDKDHRTFQYMHCWNVLRNQPKWIERRNQLAPQQPSRKKQKTTANSSDAPTASPGIANTDETNDATPRIDNQIIDRPAGRKKEKEKLRQRGYMDALDHLWAKKKEADAEKEVKKDERCKKTGRREDCT